MKEEEEEKVKDGGKEAEEEPCSESRGVTHSGRIYREPALLHCWGLEPAGPPLSGASDDQNSQPPGCSMESGRKAG